MRSKTHSPGIVRHDRCRCLQLTLGTESLKRCDFVSLEHTPNCIVQCPVKLDQATMMACRWVIVTNGDNEYSSSTFQELAQAGNMDIVAFDYYSRYQRPTAPPCERFAQAQGLPACKVNK